MVSNASKTISASSLIGIPASSIDCTKVGVPMGYTLLEGRRVCKNCIVAIVLVTICHKSTGYPIEEIFLTYSRLSLEELFVKKQTFFPSAVSFLSVSIAPSIGLSPR